MNNKKAVVLLSGGIDSTTCLAQAVGFWDNPDDVLALNIYYGQKHERELKAAKAVADYYKVDFMQRDLSQVFELSDCTLLKGRGNIPHKAYAEQINGIDPVSTYVPFRNGLFLSYASAVAMSVGASEVYYGAHMDDAAGAAYPDCSYAFALHMGEAIRQGTGSKIHMRAPLINMNKAEVVEFGLKLKAPYHLTWSCYEGGDRPCGKCGTCIDRARAFKINGVEDPALNMEG